MYQPLIINTLSFHMKISPIRVATHTKKVPRLQSVFSFPSQYIPLPIYSFPYLFILLIYFTCGFSLVIFSSAMLSYIYCHPFVLYIQSISVLRFIQPYSLRLLCSTFNLAPKLPILVYFFSNYQYEYCIARSASRTLLSHLHQHQLLLSFPLTPT